jgi:hypothetical protein
MQVCEAAEKLQPHADCFHMAYETASSWELDALPTADTPAPQGDVDMHDVENNASNNTCHEHVRQSEEPANDSLLHQEKGQVWFCRHPVCE